MSHLKDAAEIFKAREEDLWEFDVPDSFNDGQTLQGYICRIGDHRYGALYIHSVNNIPCKPQIVWGTPKMHYPFNKDGIFIWPDTKKVTAYVKYDGTNILGYSYESRGKHYVTYKTRITPVAKDGTFGGFAQMWKEIVERYPSIPKAILDNNLTLSFELYGTRNLHTIVYDVQLEAVLLFGVQGGAVIDPADVLLPAHGMCPRAEGRALRSGTELTSFYKKIRADSESENEKTDMGIKGTEGWMFYCHTVDGKVKQLKCKPESITKIHWAGSTIPRHAVHTTCINAYENTDDVTYEFVIKLLQEEFSQIQIDKSEQKIRKIHYEVQQKMEMRKRVFEIYKESGLDIRADKGDTMRHLSQFFAKKQMSAVYWILENCT